MDSVAQTPRAAPTHPPTIFAEIYHTYSLVESIHKRCEPEQKIRHVQVYV